MAAITFTDFVRLNKKFHLLDTFCGLVEECISEREANLGRKAGGYEECYESVRKTFERFPNVQIIRGMVPQTLPLVEAERVCFLSLDMNCVAPEIAAAEYFWDKLVPGATVVLDDYGFPSYVAQKEAFDAFAVARGVRVLGLPTGQGLIVKP